jgi:ribosomal-protein-alanine N-acetyltransferase
LRDFRQLVKLEKLCFGKDSWSWLDMLAALNYPDTVRLKAEKKGQVVGFAIGDRRRRNGLGWIASIGVHPAHRRRGIGRQLLEASEAALGTKRIRLSLRASNRAAQGLYDQAGYEVVDAWPGYYANGEDALVMEKRRDG